MKNLKQLGKTLGKIEQNLIFGGKLQATDDQCCLSHNHGPFNDCGYSVSQAQGLYNISFEVGDSGPVTGYCCASC